MPRLPVPGGDKNIWGDLLNGYLLREHAADGTHNVKAMLEAPAGDGLVAVSAPGAAKGLQWRQLQAGDVGLGNVNNTADADKPISAAQQAALNAKQDRAGAVFSLGIPVLQPAVGAFVVWRAPFAARLDAIRAYRVGGTGAAVNARKNAVSNHMAADLSVSVENAWLDGGTVQNAVYNAGDTLEVMITAATGSPSQLILQLDWATL